jgi:hypothetical protein
MPDEVKDDADKAKVASQDQAKDDKKEEAPPKWVNDLFTRIGRVDAETKKRFETLEGKIESGLRVRQESESKGSEDPLNKKYTEQVLQGDFTGAVDDYMTRRRQAENALAQREQKAVDKLLSDMEEAKAPYFGEVKDGIKKVAGELVRQGYSPQDAVAFAYEKNRADYLHKKVSGETPEFDSASLETSGGGSVREDSAMKKGKLNADGKKAWEKNKAYFKDEADYISHMSPLVRQRFVG